MFVIRILQVLFLEVFQLLNANFGVCGSFSGYSHSSNSSTIHFIAQKGNTKIQAASILVAPSIPDSSENQIFLNLCWYLRERASFTVSPNWEWRCYSLRWTYDFPASKFMQAPPPLFFPHIVLSWDICPTGTSFLQHMWTLEHSWALVQGRDE